MTEISEAGFCEDGRDIAAYLAKNHKNYLLDEIADLKAALADFNGRNETHLSINTLVQTFNGKKSPGAEHVSAFVTYYREAYEINISHGDGVTLDPLTAEVENFTETEECRVIANAISEFIHQLVERSVLAQQHLDPLADIDSARVTAIMEYLDAEIPDLERLSVLAHDMLEEEQMTLYEVILKRLRIGNRPVAAVDKVDQAHYFGLSAAVLNKLSRSSSASGGVSALAWRRILGAYEERYVSQEGNDSFIPEPEYIPKQSPLGAIGMSMNGDGMFQYLISEDEVIPRIVADKICRMTMLNQQQFFYKILEHLDAVDQPISRMNSFFGVNISSIHPRAETSSGIESSDAWMMIVQTLIRYKQSKPVFDTAPLGFGSDSEIVEIVEASKLFEDIESPDIGKVAFRISKQPLEIQQLLFLNIRNVLGIAHLNVSTTKEGVQSQSNTVNLSATVLGKLQMGVSADSVVTVKSWEQILKIYNEAERLEGQSWITEVPEGGEGTTLLPEGAEEVLKFLAEASEDTFDQLAIELKDQPLETQQLLFLNIRNVLGIAHLKVSTTKEGVDSQSTVFGLSAPVLAKLQMGVEGDTGIRAKSWEQILEVYEQRDTQESRWITEVPEITKAAGEEKLTQTDFTGKTLFEQIGTAGGMDIETLAQHAQLLSGEEQQSLFTQIRLFLGLEKAPLQTTKEGAVDLQTRLSTSYATLMKLMPNSKNPGGVTATIWRKFLNLCSEYQTSLEASSQPAPSRNDNKPLIEPGSSEDRDINRAIADFLGNKGSDSDDDSSEIGTAVEELPTEIEFMGKSFPISFEDGLTPNNLPEEAGDLIGKQSEALVDLMDDIGVGDLDVEDFYRRFNGLGAIPRIYFAIAYQRQYGLPQPNGAGPAFELRLYGSKDKPQLVGKIFASRELAGQVLEHACTYKR